MPKVELFNKEEALLKAMNLFWNKGYNNTSLNDLTNALGIGKGSLYNTFKSKRNLFEECVIIYKNNSISGLKEVLEAEINVKKGLCNFLKINLEYAINDPQHRGCFLTNTCTELANSDQQLNQSIQEHYKDMRAIISNYLTNNSDLTNEVISNDVNIIITFFIGMTVQVKLNENKENVESSINSLIESLF